MNIKVVYKFALLCLLAIPLSVSAAWVNAVDELEISADPAGVDFQSDFLTFDYSNVKPGVNGNAKRRKLEIETKFAKLTSEYTNNGVTTNYANTWFRITGKANSNRADLTLEIFQKKNIHQKRTNLLQGSLSNWSYAVDNSLGAVFNFVFTDLSGVLAADYGSSAAVMFADSTFAANFNFDKNLKTSGTSGRANTVSVPEPSAIFLMIMGLFFMAYCNKRKA